MNAPIKPTFNRSEPRKPQEYIDVTETHEIRLDNYDSYSVDYIKSTLEELTRTEIEYKDIQVYIEFSNGYRDSLDNYSKAYVVIKKEQNLNPKFSQQMAKYNQDSELYLLKKAEFNKAKKDYQKQMKEYENYLKHQQIENAKKLLRENGVKEI